MLTFLSYGLSVPDVKVCAVIDIREFFRRASFDMPQTAAYELRSVLMDKRDQPIHDVNPFCVQIEGPMQSGATAVKWAPKIDDTGDIGRIGSIHGGGDWG